MVNRDLLKEAIADEADSDERALERCPVKCLGLPSVKEDTGQSDNARDRGAPILNHSIVLLK